MFKNRNMDAYNSNYEMNMLQRIMYELDDINRKLRNLNNRLKRVEGFLGLTKEDDIST